MPTPLPQGMNIPVKFYVATRDGRVLQFDSLDTGQYAVSFGSVSTVGSTGSIPVFIDPISAVWMRLISPEQLGLSEQTLAVLKLAMQDVLP